MMRKYVLILFVGLVVVSCTVSELQASIKNRPFSIQLVLNGIQPALNDSAQIWLFSPYWGCELQRMVSPRFAIVGAVRSGKIYNDSISTSIFKYNNDRANRRWSLTGISLGPKYYLNQRGHTTPYVQSRFEMLLWNIKSHPANDVIVVENADGNARDYKATELGITIGLGLERLIADRIAFSIGAEYTHFTGIGADFAQWVKNSRSRAILQFGVGVSVHFGGKHRSMLEESEEEAPNPNRISRKVYEDEFEEKRDTAISVPSPIPVRVDTVQSVPAQVASPVANVDSDGDGVADHRDLCPNTPKRVAVDSTGCVMDLDNDGVENSIDKCPDTPRAMPVDQHGCPDLTKIFVKQVYHKLFNSGEVKIKSDQTAAIDSIIAMLRMFPGVSVMVYGYTDDVGPNDGNLQLSQRRASAVKQYMITAGVAESRITAIGRGESNFMASNRTRGGRELNRRIEIEFKF